MKQRNFAKKLKEPIYQPFIMGSELSAETWIDRLENTWNPNEMEECCD